MFGKTLVAYIYAETPLHPGSGTSISGIADLPIQRERHTEFPLIQGSSLKGVLRNSARLIRLRGNQCIGCPERRDDKYEEKCELCGQIFGTKDGIGGISVTDARILAFPVRALKGVFGWIICPIVLDRYKRDMELIGRKENDWEIPKPTGNEEARVCGNSNLTEEYIYIEDLQLECSKDKNVEEIAENIAKALPDNDAYKEIKEKLKKDLVIVSDDVFRDLVSLTTEVVTRIKIDPTTGTVETGGLWSEEYLPTDTLMYSLILIPSKLSNLKPDNVQTKIMKYDERILQIGGDETIGKGFARIKIVEGG